MKEFKKYADATIDSKLSRRKFLSSGALLSISALAVAVAPNVAAAASKTELDVESGKKDEGYRLTQHIADYYKSAAL